MELSVKMRPLSQERYAKTNFRMEMAALSYPEKVRQVVELQNRIVPICAVRGRVVVPWTLDRDEVVHGLRELPHGDSARFYGKLGLRSESLLSYNG